MQKFLPAIILFLVSCREVTVPAVQNHFRDSIIRQYLVQVDSFEYYDTTDYYFKALKAYYKNDSSFLKQMIKDIEFARKYDGENSYFDSCVQLRKLSDLNVDEVYRFRHSESFCFYNQFVTISRNGGMILLHYLEVSVSPDGKTFEYFDKEGPKKIGPGCRIEKEFSKSLTNKDWEILEGYIEVADYWGLKSHSPRAGLDGSSWTIEAYSKQPKYITEQQIHSVYRWSPVNSFADLGRMFMKLALEKGLCGGF